MTIKATQPEDSAERPKIDANALELMARERPNEMFLKGSGVLKLIEGIRHLEQQNRELRAALAAPSPQQATTKEAGGEASARHIVEAVQAMSIGGKDADMPTPFQSGYQLACEEILARIGDAPAMEPDDDWGESPEPSPTRLGAFSCARRAADPANESATCTTWCGNSLTCLTSGEPDLLSLITQHGNASRRQDVDAASRLYKMIIAALPAAVEPTSTMSEADRVMLGALTVKPRAAAAPQPAEAKTAAASGDATDAAGLTPLYSTRQNAKRYQVLRDAQHGFNAYRLQPKDGKKWRGWSDEGDILKGSELDAAIDAAIASTQEGGR